MVRHAAFDIFRVDFPVFLHQKLAQAGVSGGALQRVNLRLHNKMVGMGHDAVLRLDHIHSAGIHFKINGFLLLVPCDHDIAGHRPGEVQDELLDLVEGLVLQQLPSGEHRGQSHRPGVVDGLQIVADRPQPVAVHSASDHLSRLGETHDPGAVRLGDVDDHHVIHDPYPVIPVFHQVHLAVFGSLGQHRSRGALIFLGEFGNFISAVNHHDVRQ